MKKLLFLLSICFLAGCSQTEHFISDGKYLRQTQERLKEKQTFFADKSLFEVVKSDSLTSVEREALTFLYAYMPIGDVTDYNGEFYLRNVRASLATRAEMTWGATIPEDVFRHFVLPIRVNNENLDDSRISFYGELRDRVKNLSLADAVLEVNHWCHEKVVYVPSDSRTSSPLASVKSAYGRCGEESVFTVAALRSVGIPARQVYTPRWAHTDDNHAWVEAWVDGKWCFMGACEPEPVLNLGWFNTPASRGMLMHTKVFGDYYGPEEVMERTACYTEINVIDNYAPTARAVVKVTDKDGKPIPNALVEFKIYNYAEFYTVARKTTDASGECFLTAGRGDMVVWATDASSKFGYEKVSFGKDDAVTVILDKTPDNAQTLEYDIIPPSEGSNPVVVTDEQRAANNLRLQYEDSIRNAYTATFVTQTSSLPEFPDTAAVRKFLINSRGNYAEITAFLNSITTQNDKECAVKLLNAISSKDLRDTKATTLLDHLFNTLSFENRYVFNPRVSNELLTPYKSFFIKNFDTKVADQARLNPQKLVEWVHNNINVKDYLNPQTIAVMPVGVFRGKVADKHSRNIFFVALARSLGIPARIEPVAGKVQYFNNQWIDVDFGAETQTIAPQGFVELTIHPTKTLKTPEYHSHFTIAKIQTDGRLRTQGFNFGRDADMGGSDPNGEMLRRKVTLDEGNYLLVTGRRMASGKVQSRISFFNVKANETTPVDLIVRENDSDVKVIGSIDAEKTFLTETGSETSILKTTGRGYFIIGIIGSRQEPTNHALHDIEKLKDDFEQWKRPIILLFTKEEDLKFFNTNEFARLPKTVVYGVDANAGIAGMITDAMKATDRNQLPIFVVADTFGRVVFFSQGYTIGLGEQMMKTIKGLQE
ncbi:MAG: transglutaminase domain-containing protein [Tannerella sp.]|jgi:transglutaminase-like putative cysteine protease|nr:transglutaminase domain-containing protein [Tannerella sp.]